MNDDSFQFFQLCLFDSYHSEDLKDLLCSASEVTKTRVVPSSSIIGIFHLIMHYNIHRFHDRLSSLLIRRLAARQGVRQLAARPGEAAGPSEAACPTESMVGCTRGWLTVHDGDVPVRQNAGGGCVGFA
nr:hypothetical protein Iba_chr12aCG11980 [Ipomoea batatas]